MRQYEIKEAIARGRATIRPSKWVEGRGFAVPIKQRAASADGAKSARSRQIKLIIGILQQCRTPRVVGLQRRRVNRSLREAVRGRRSVFSPPEGDDISSPEALEMAAFAKAKA